MSEILPKNTNFIITKKIPTFGTDGVSWPLNINTGEPIEIGTHGFIIGLQPEGDVIRQGYLVRLQDEVAYYVPRESFEIIDENVKIFRIYKIYGIFRIKDVKLREALRGKDEEILQFNSEELAKEYLLENFEEFSYGS